MNKKELEEHVKTLRDMLAKAQDKIQDLTTQQKNDTIKDNVSVGGFYDESKKKWNLVIVDYNKDDKTAQVREIKEAGDSFDMLRFRMEEFIADNILLANNRRK